MMGDPKVILGLAAVVVGLIGYVPYYRDIFRGTTKPHPFSWIGFSLLLGITFFAQMSTGAGAGAWVTGLSSLATFGIAILSFTKGERDITRFDWLCFVGALLGIVFWRATSNPLTAVVIVTVVDAAVFLPTYRKAYFKPREETMTLYVFSALKWLISISALASFNLTSTLFPVSVVTTNTAFVIMLLIRRRQLAKR